MVERNGSAWFREHVVALVCLILVMLSSLTSWWATYAVLTDRVQRYTVRVEDIEMVVRTHVADSTRHIDPVRDARINDEILRRMLEVELAVKAGNERLNKLR